MNESRFAFPDDEGKTPLVEMTVEMNEKDWLDLVQTASFRSLGNKIAYIVFMVLCATFTIYIAFIAVLSKSIPAVIVYTASAAFFLCMLFYFKPYSKYVSKLFPNNYKSKTYRFYLHHFICYDENSAASLSYDLTAAAYENACGFTMIMTDGSLYYIPKHDLSAEASTMLHHVMVNKFGSKFKATAL